MSRIPVPASKFRSIRSFGVSGFLSSEGAILHEVFRDASGLGRVSDLVAARLRAEGPDEFVLHFQIIAGVLGTGHVFEGMSPVSFECGFDRQLFVFSFGFDLPDISVIAWDSLAERVRTGVVVSRLDELLQSICRHSDRAFIKCDPRSGRVEIVSLNAWGVRESSAVSSLEVIVFSDSPEAAPPVAEVTALGDLDYARLLRRDGESTGADEASSEEVIVDRDAPDREDGTKRIEGDGGDLQDSSIVRISGGASADEPARPRGFFSKIARWIRPTPHESQDTTTKRVTDENANASIDHSPSATAPSEVTMDSSEVQGVAVQIDQMMSEGIIGRVTREVTAIQAEVKSPRVERWVETLLSELNAERARIVEVSKRLAASVRLKEQEFKNRENTLQQQLREKDAAIRSKTTQLIRAKDQAAKLQISLERTKMGGGAGDDTAMKFKLGQSQRMLQSARSENESLRLRLDEMQSKVQQLSDQSRQSVPAASFRQLQRQFDKQSRELEDLKRHGTPANEDQTRKNLEVAQRVALHQKKKSEQLELVVQEQNVELERLKQEIERLRAERSSSAA